jgi:hypothetical protein
VIGFSVGWAVAGLIAGLILKWAAPSVTLGQVLALTIGWPICFTGGLLSDSIIGIALSISAVAALALWVLRSVRPSIALGRAVMVSIGWGIACLSVWLILGDGDWQTVFHKITSGYPIQVLVEALGAERYMGLAIGGVISALIGGGVMFGLLYQARVKDQSGRT